MPSTFIDVIDAKDLLIVTESNWTITPGSFPNGEASARKTAQTGHRTFGIVGTDFGTAERYTALSFWIRPKTGWASGELILQAATIGGAGEQWHTLSNGLDIDGKALLNCWSNRLISMDVVLELNVWHHIVLHIYIGYAFTTSSFGSILSYVDGVVGPSASSGGTNVWRPGGTGDDTGLHLMAPTTIPACDLAHISWFNKQLTGAEVTQLYEAGMNL